MPGCVFIPIICTCTCTQVVDGVITQDGDAFLYGATCVYKDMSTNSKVREI